MLATMRRELKEAKELKAKVIAPHNKRIKALTSAIRNAEAFNKVSEEINEATPVVVGTIPELNQQAEGE
jgi:hypothetical protein